MGLPRCTFNEDAKGNKKCNDYDVVIITAGPLNDQIYEDSTDFKSQVLSGIKWVFKANLAECKVAVEKSSDGYIHTHVIYKLIKRAAWKRALDKVKALVDKLPHNDGETRKPNGSSYYWPRTTKDKWLAAQRYLICPTKSKEVDDDLLDFEQPDWVDVLLEAYINFEWFAIISSSNNMKVSDCCPLSIHLHDMSMREAKKLWEKHRFEVHRRYAKLYPVGS